MLQDAVARIRYDRGLLDKLLEAFEEDNPRLLALLDQALEQRDHVALKAVAHALKGTLAVFHFDAGVAAAQALETFFNDRSDCDEAAARIHLFKDLVMRFASALQSAQGRAGI
jgi:HPt (histidine-containing phosphotransfer) domain-containing protein